VTVIELMRAWDDLCIFYLGSYQVVHGKLLTMKLPPSVFLTLSQPIPLKLYTLPYWSNPSFLIFDIRAFWRSVLSARVPECQKLKMMG